MNIGIIGAGNVGTGIGRRLAARGHRVLLSFSRSPEKLEEAAEALGGNARTGAVEDAATFGEVVLFATPWAVTLDVGRRAAPFLDAKIVWDATNPLAPDMSGLSLGTTTSGGEALAEAVAGARVVKAVPPFAEVLHSSSTLVDGRRPAVFVCGDDDMARQVVLGLVDEIEARGIDAGPLQSARYTEPLGMLLVQLAYARGFGARLGVDLLREHAPG